MREKDLGIWQSWTWAEAAEQVRALACGLAALGFKRGDNLAIIGDNRPQLYWAMAAAQCLGGVPVPLYQDSVANEMAYILDNADVRFAVVEDQEQVDKLLEIKDRLPKLDTIIYEDPRGMRHYGQPFLHVYADVQQTRRAVRRRAPGFLPARSGAGSGRDVAIMLYTSGTTGKPKGVCQTHAALIAAARGGVRVRPAGPRRRDSVLSADGVGRRQPLLLRAGAGRRLDHQLSRVQRHGDDGHARDRSDLLLRAAARVREPADAGHDPHGGRGAAQARLCSTTSSGVARRCGAEILDGKPGVAVRDRFSTALGNMLVYGPLRNVLGMSRIRVAYTAGAAIGPDLFRFYRSIGVNLKQLYGSTETCAYVCLQPDGQIKLDTRRAACARCRGQDRRTAARCWSGAPPC